MRAILSHVGAWSPKAEQVATANFLANKSEVDEYLHAFKKNIHKRLDAFYIGMTKLKAKGYHVDAIPPQAAIYLTVKFDLVGKTQYPKIRVQQPFLLIESGAAITSFTDCKYVNSDRIM